MAQKIVTRKGMTMFIQRHWALAQQGDVEARRKLEHYVGRALVALFDRQEQDEKQVNDTKHHNTIGFTAADGKSGCIGAKTFLRHGGFPEDWQLERWVKDSRGAPRLAKYHRQLNEVAVAKANKKAVEQSMEAYRNASMSSGMSRQQAIASGAVTYTGD